MLDVSQIISQSVYPVQNTSGVCLPAFALKNKNILLSTHFLIMLKIYLIKIKFSHEGAVNLLNFLSALKFTVESNLNVLSL